MAKPRLWGGLTAQAVLLLLASCNSKGPGPGPGECGADGSCPGVLVCDTSTNMCVQPGGGTDARPPDAPPPAPDATVADAVPGSPPDTTITNQPAALGNVTMVTFEFKSSITPATFECELDSATFAACTTPLVATVAPGTHEFLVRAIAGGVTDPSPAKYDFVVDTTAPDTTITSGPSGNTATSEATFTFTSSEPNSTFQCTIDGGAAAACTSGQSYTGLALGSHTFTVVATDAAGNVDPTAATATWNVTVITPNTTITANPPAATASTTATFAFTSDQPAATFECALDSGTFTACATPMTFTGLAEGTHGFAVRAVLAGVDDPTPATYTWVVDHTGPTAVITGGPNNGGASTNHPDFTYTTRPQETATFACSLTNGGGMGSGFTSCPTTGQGYSGLVDQTMYTFCVEATDLVGNTGPAVCTSFTVDTTGPTVTITAPADGSTVPSSFALDFTFTSETGATFTCSLDGGATITDCTSGQIFMMVSVGMHTVSVTGVDSLGNTGNTATSSFTVGPAATVSIVSPSGGSVTGPSTTIIYTAGHAASLVCTFDGHTVVCPLPADGEAGFYQVMGGSNGSHTFTVQGFNAAGEPGESATVTFTIDANGPVIDISTPVDPNAGGQGGFTCGSGDILVHCDTGLSDLRDCPAAQLDCQMDTGPIVRCDSGDFPFSGLSDGTHTVSVYGLDFYNNRGNTTRTSFTAYVNPPVVNAISLASTTPSASDPYSVVCGTPGTPAVLHADYTITLNDPNITVSCLLDGVDVTGREGVTCTPTTFELAGVPDGFHTLTIHAEDGCLNPEPDAEHPVKTRTVSLYIENSAPSVIMPSLLPDDGGSYNLPVSDTLCKVQGSKLTFHVVPRILSEDPAQNEPPSTTYKCSLNGATATDCGVAIDERTATMVSSFTSREGADAITVVATDVCGHVAPPVELDYTTDTTPPKVVASDVTFTSQAGSFSGTARSSGGVTCSATTASALGTASTISFVSDDPTGTFLCAVDPADPTDPDDFTTCDDFALDSSEDGGGAFNFDMITSDPCGNLGTPSVPFVVDVTGPTVTNPRSTENTNGDYQITYDVADDTDGVGGAHLDAKIPSIGYEATGLGGTGQTVQWNDTPPGAHTAILTGYDGCENAGTGLSFDFTEDDSPGQVLLMGHDWVSITDDNNDPPEDNSETDIEVIMNNAISLTAYHRLDFVNRPLRVSVLNVQNCGEARKLRPAKARRPGEAPPEDCGVVDPTAIANLQATISKRFGDQGDDNDEWIYNEIGNYTDFANALVSNGPDVLVVPAQGDPCLAGAIGTDPTWQVGLNTFMTNGGVVIVLDSASSNNGCAEENFRVLESCQPYDCEEAPGCFPDEGSTRRLGEAPPESPPTFPSCGADNIINVTFAQGLPLSDGFDANASDVYVFNDPLLLVDDGAFVGAIEDYLVPQNSAYFEVRDPNAATTYELDECESEDSSRKLNRVDGLFNLDTLDDYPDCEKPDFRPFSDRDFGDGIDPRYDAADPAIANAIVVHKIIAGTSPAIGPVTAVQAQQGRKGFEQSAEFVFQDANPTGHVSPTCSDSGTTVVAGCVDFAASDSRGRAQAFVEPTTQPAAGPTSLPANPMVTDLLIGLRGDVGEGSSSRAVTYTDVKPADLLWFDRARVDTIDQMFDAEDDGGPETFGLNLYTPGTCFESDRRIGETPPTTCASLGGGDIEFDEPEGATNYRIDVGCEIWDLEDGPIDDDFTWTGCYHGDPSNPLITAIAEAMDDSGNVVAWAEVHDFPLTVDGDEGTIWPDDWSWHLVSDEDYNPLAFQVTQQPVGKFVNAAIDLRVGVAGETNTEFDEWYRDDGELDFSGYTYFDPYPPATAAQPVVTVHKQVFLTLADPVDVSPPTSEPVVFATVGLLSRQPVSGDEAENTDEGFLPNIVAAEVDGGSGAEFSSPTMTLTFASPLATTGDSAVAGLILGFALSNPEGGAAVLWSFVVPLADLQSVGSNAYTFTFPVSLSAAIDPGSAAAFSFNSAIVINDDVTFAPDDAHTAYDKLRAFGPNTDDLQNELADIEPDDGYGGEFQNVLLYDVPAPNLIYTRRLSGAAAPPARIIICGKEVCGTVGGLRVGRPRSQPVVPGAKHRKVGHAKHVHGLTPVRHLRLSPEVRREHLQQDWDAFRIEDK